MNESDTAKHATSSAKLHIKNDLAKQKSEKNYPPPVQHITNQHVIHHPPQNTHKGCRLYTRAQSQISNNIKILIYLKNEG